ncbi:putative HTH-type transcriptional regulator ImmR [[Clostridium] ultunense Esp]|nr:putative HTH-type transcriptional regulator ImmR [[Clostridium] ultunense Esp]
MEGFGTRLKSAIKKTGLTQKSAAEKLNISTQALTNYISKNRIPEAMILYRIAKLCSVTMEWLLTGEDPTSVEKPGRTEEKGEINLGNIHLLPEETKVLHKFRQLSRDKQIKVEGIIEGLLICQECESRQEGEKIVKRKSKRERRRNAPNKK